MEDKYIILNATNLEKILKRLRDEIEVYKITSPRDWAVTQEKINLLVGIFSKSIPLIPEIERAYYNGGDMKGLEEFNYYISHLKLEI